MKSKDKMKHMAKKKHMKHGGHAEGHKAKHRLDKYNRGGGVKASASMTPSSPLSGAGNMSKRPGLKPATVDSADD